MATQAVQELLDKAGLEPADISQLTSTTVTGLAVPSLDALMNTVGFSRDTADAAVWPWLFGRCGGHQPCGRLLEGSPDQAAVLVAVELCSPCSGTIFR